MGEKQKDVAAPNNYNGDLTLVTVEIDGNSALLSTKHEELVLYDTTQHQFHGRTIAEGASLSLIEWVQEDNSTLWRLANKSNLSESTKWKWDGEWVATK